MKKHFLLSVLLSSALIIPALAQNSNQQQQQQRRPRTVPGMQLTVDVMSVHDPVMAKEGDTFYLFCTGNGITMMSSKDLKTWTFHGSVLPEVPSWIPEALPQFRGSSFWAPDVIFHNGRWHIYYSASAFGRNTSLIAHISNKTLDPNSPDYSWKDEGKIVQSVPSRDMFNAIDPNIVVDNEGTPWLDFGSFWDGIKLVKLKEDLSGVAQPEEWYSICSKPRTFGLPATSAGDAPIEAPFIYKHGKYFYLFASFDYCCRGVNSTYKVAVGRSEDVKGPYLDKEGKRLDQGGGSIVIEGNKDWNGIGHNAAYTFDGKDYFISHAYDANDNGQSKLILREIKWVEDWPVVEW